MSRRNLLVSVLLGATFSFVSLFAATSGFAATEPDATSAATQSADANPAYSQVYLPPVWISQPPIYVTNPPPVTYVYPPVVNPYPPVVLPGPVIVRSPWRPFLRTFIP
ncbi:MAG: hypothetical protein Q4G68_03365 [Planctomycetia bacterium]|nr:hypothetical protein [Planctomycetia bacterium]